MHVANIRVQEKHHEVMQDLFQQDDDDV
jgi:hypothetical protein